MHSRKYVPADTKVHHRFVLASEFLHFCLNSEDFFQVSAHQLGYAALFLLSGLQTPVRDYKVQPMALKALLTEFLCHSPTIAEAGPSGPIQEDSNVRALLHIKA